VEKYEPFMADEKSIVKRNMKDMLFWANIEYSKYTKTKHTRYLQQACEKLFNAVELYLSFISNCRFYSHNAPYDVVKEKTLLNLFDDASKLHQFFYNAENRMPAWRASNIFKSVRRRIQYRIKKIK